MPRRCSIVHLPYSPIPYLRHSLVAYIIAVQHGDDVSDERVMQVRNGRVRKVDDAAATWHSCSISDDNIIRLLALRPPVGRSFKGHARSSQRSKRRTRGHWFNPPTRHVITTCLLQMVSGAGIVHVQRKKNLPCGRWMFTPRREECNGTNGMCIMVACSIMMMRAMSE